MGNNGVARSCAELGAGAMLTGCGNRAARLHRDGTGRHGTGRKEREPSKCWRVFTRKCDFFDDKIATTLDFDCLRLETG
jgi:hypothetical protein